MRRSHLGKTDLLYEEAMHFVVLVLELKPKQRRSVF